ncbi:STAS domain-containing protein [Desulfosporosinus hippei]|uniref:RsbT antagonist protein RsbS n=1 Tax=Desulfosporosinus hippei DSM 8344 TaxID=1121419 RepID=A0A1G7WBM6_9FIRM|nr:STAS domain-containing protein [Desulfosporosinus hippei]SDG69352.1 rsbT antagonist protein RsbS [Desulfosporosinus hippei DSM 8344]
MDKTSLLKIGKVLILSIEGEVNDFSVVSMQDMLLKEVRNTSTRGVILNIARLEIVDSYMARVLSDTARMIRLMGGITILVGVNPMIALTMVDMGLDIKEVKTALNLDAALELLTGLTTLGRYSEESL